MADKEQMGCSGAHEIACTTDSSSGTACVLVWDTSTWMQIRAYKQGVCSKKCLCHLKQNYIIAGQQNKPLLHIWNFEKEQMNAKMICPGNISALAVSNNGVYCAGACSEKIYMWEISSGNLLCILSRHFQTVTCLKFTDDSSHLVSGADDNIIFVWPLMRLLPFSTGYQVENISPKHTWSNHSSPITSLHVGYGGGFCRVTSSSLDQTCKLWDLSSGDLLRTFVFNIAIFSVVMDAAEYRLFAGGLDGKIYVRNLFSQSSVKNSGRDEDEQCFLQHSKQVTSLALSMDGLTLFSGSKDCTARVWDVTSRQCLKVLKHEGCVDNVLIMPRPANLNSEHSKYTLPVIGTFKRNLFSYKERSNTNTRDVDDCIPVKIPRITALDEQRSGQQNGLIESVLKENCEEQQKDGCEVKLTRRELAEELKSAKGLNENLYRFVVEEIVGEIRKDLEP